ncbi:MAG: hypothetical protein M1828_000208 [Chrysothrix sp. TS-e1954]|nr:MAG: hypothetical protein M1828_000208 [Chrysothrix sp. TS-e1954]
MLADFDIWAGRRQQSNFLTDLKDAVIAIEADWFLDRILTNPPAHEALLPALGGLPFGLKKCVNSELATLHDAGITPIFIFNGMQVGDSYRPFHEANSIQRASAQAWDSYLKDMNAAQSVKAFSASGAHRASRFQKVFQNILRQAKVDFRIAPFSARGQLAYLNKQTPQYVDAIAGSSELLLYGVEQVITKFDFELSDFTFVKQKDCLDEFNNIPFDFFVDACLLAGTDMLQALPHLLDMPGRRTAKTYQAVEMIKQHGSGIAVCQAFGGDQKAQEMNYVDRFRRLRVAIKHSLISSSEGKVVPFEADSIPNDLHLVAGQRLPDELYYYIWCGTISPRVPNQLTSGQIYETCPLDGGESEAYHQLVKNKLAPIRSTSLALLASSLHRAYQYREIKISCWFERDKQTSINLREVTPPVPIINTWNVHEDIIKTSSIPMPTNMTLDFALQSLKDSDFATKTITKKDKDTPNVLTTKTEVMANTFWRFLHLSGYINEDHQLSHWGLVLSSILTHLQTNTTNPTNPTTNSEEAAFLAVELLRHDLLTTSDLFPTYIETSVKGSETDKRNTLFVSRLCCLTSLRHPEKGYSGPLSRHLLGFNSMIDAIRTTSRDLLETCLATLLLNGDCSRDRDPASYTSMGLDLPFLLPTDCAMGVAMRSYLSELHAAGDPTSAQSRSDVKTKKVAQWFLNATSPLEDLDAAFGFWDAVVKGVKTASEKGVLLPGGGTGGGKGSPREKWDAVDAWVQKRR